MSYVDIQVTQESQWLGCIKSNRSKWAVSSQKSLSTISFHLRSQTLPDWQHRHFLPVPCQSMFTFSLNIGINEAPRVTCPYRLGCPPRYVSVWVCQASAWFSRHLLFQFLPCRTCEHTLCILLKSSLYDPAASNQITMFNYQLNKWSVKIYRR